MVNKDVPDIEEDEEDIFFKVLLQIIAILLIIFGVLNFIL